MEMPGGRLDSICDDFFLHPFDHRLGVFTGAHDHGATDGFLTVEVERTAAEIAADLHGGDVLQIDRSAFHGFDRDEFEILRAFDQADAAQDELRAVLLHHLAADVEVGILDGGHHLHERDVRGPHLGGVQLDLILLHEAADAGDLRDSLNAGELIADVPVLHGAEFREVVTTIRGFIGIDGKVILIDPAKA